MVTLDETYTSEPFTPETCGFVAHRLERAIAILEGNNIRVSDVSRLKDSMKLLLRMANDGKFPPDKQLLRRIAMALNDALDYSQILRVFHPDLVSSVASELQRAIGGARDQPQSLRKSLTFQSQFWVGAVLAHSGAEVVVPPLSPERTPDYYVLNGTLRHGVEVKRPHSTRHLRALLSGAAEQLQAQRAWGAVVLDISDCLPESDLFAVEGSEESSLFHASDAHVDRITKESSGLILSEINRRGYTSRFSAIVTLAVFARGWRWKSDLSAPVFFSNCRTHVFYSAAGNLRWHRGYHLSLALARGMRNLGGATVEEVSTQANRAWTRMYERDFLSLMD